MSNKTFAAITPSDTNDLPSPISRIYVGVAGDIAVLGYSPMGTADTTAVTFKAVPAGWWSVGSQISRVLATGTTATNLLAFTQGNAW